MKDELIRGDTCIIEFDLFDDDGNPILLSEIEEIVFTARRMIGSEILIRKTIKDVSCSDKNHYEIEIAPEDTEDMKTDFGYDVEITLKNGARGTLIGEIKIIYDYSKRKDGVLSEN